MPVISDSNSWSMLILEIFSSYDIKNGQFQFLVAFLAVFFWCASYIILVKKLYLLFQTILNLWPVLILEIFIRWDIKKGQFQFVVAFLAVFFWSSNYVILVCISPHILNMELFYLSVFSNYFFSFWHFKHLKSIFSGNFSRSENVTVLVCKLYMPGL